MIKNNGVIVHRIKELVNSDLGDDELGIKIRELFKEDEIETSELSMIFIEYNKIAERYGFSRATKLTPTRRVHLRAQIGRYGSDHILETLQRMAKSPAFNSHYKTWFTLDWFLNDNNYVKILEGKYDNLFINKTAEKIHTAISGQNNYEFSSLG